MTSSLGSWHSTTELLPLSGLLSNDTRCRLQAPCKHGQSAAGVLTLIKEKNPDVNKIAFA